MTGGRAAWGHVAVLVLLGAGWGMTQPLSKIAVSTGHGHFGLIFWQLAIGAALLGAFAAWRGRPLPLTAATLRTATLVALIGTLVPNSASYQAIAHLPAGVISILISMVPMIAFPIALALGLEGFRPRRLLGLTLGLAGVLLLVLPEASLPDPAMLVWIPVALVAPACYAFEGNYVARWGTAGLDPIQLLFAASVIGAALALPLAVSTGQFISPLRPWAAPEAALVASAAIHAVVYTGYVWLVGRAGPVFAVQVSYLVTGFGVLAALAMLGESYSPWIWTALALVLAGMALVQPRPQDRVAAAEPIGDTPRQA